MAQVLEVLRNDKKVSKKKVRITCAVQVFTPSKTRSWKYSGGEKIVHKKAPPCVSSPRLAMSMAFPLLQ